MIVKETRTEDTTAQHGSVGSALGSDSWVLNSEGFILRKPLEFRPWINYLSNDEYGLRLSHLGDGYSTTLQEPRRVVTHWEQYSCSPLKGRYVYIRDWNDPTKALWNPTYYPTKTALDSYRCRHVPGWTSFESVRDGIQTESKHFVPLKGRHEVWKIRVKNLSEQSRRLAIYPQAEFNLHETLELDVVYYSWFTNSISTADMREMRFIKTDQPAVLGFLVSLEKPVSYEASLKRFKGEGDMQRPEALFQEKLGNTPSSGDPFIGCLQFVVDLEPGAVWENSLFIGEGEEELQRVRTVYRQNSDVEKAFDAVRTGWAARLQNDRVPAVSSDPKLRDWLGTFLPYQIYQQSKGMVRSFFRGFRDVAQDAIGMSYYNITESRALILTLLDKQYRSGKCLRQWNTSNGKHDTRDFRDLPLWLPMAVTKYLENGGNPDILTECRPYLDENRRVTLFQHMTQGLAYCLKFGRHGLIQMGEGDWNDALSGLGSEGESLWLSQFMYYALSLFEDLFEKYGRSFGLSHPFDIEELKDRLYRGVLEGWTGKWFLRGYHSDGTVIGGDERIYLLPQAWFVLSGMGSRDPQKATRALDSMLENLNNEHGLLKCYPAFDSYDPKIGRMSALAPGMAENYAVYNHASSFGIYALLMEGRVEAARSLLKKLLPFYKDERQTKAEPYVLVNFYNGGYFPDRAGEGGIPWLTGTANWLAMIMFDFVIPKSIVL